VRDEAAVGRDTGRLVPVTIDGTEPPLGFRQYQTVVIPHGRFRAGSAEMAELIEALGTASVPVAEPRRSKRLDRFRMSRPWFAALAALAVAVIAGGWWWATRASAHLPTVAIDGANDRSRDVARQLAVRLGDLQSARGDAFRLISGSGDADLIIQINANDNSTSLNRDVTVLSGGDKAILWSTSLQQPPAKAGDLSQELTVTSGRVLSCALEALSDRRDRIDALVLKQYLSGCSRLESDYGLGQYDPKLAGLFEQVTASAPHLNGAWARLLQTETEAARAPDPPPALVQSLRKHISQVEKLGLNIGEVYAAKAALLPTSDFLGTFALYDQGIRADPYNAYLFRLHSERLQAVGRMSEAVQDAGTALQFDPLSPALLDNYVSALAYAGKIDAAYAQLGKAEALWPSAENLKFARYRLDLRFGDPKEALATLHSSGTVTAQAQESFLEARIQPTPANIQRAIDDERAISAQEPRDIVGLMQALGQFGRKDEAIGVLLNYRRPEALGYNAEVLFRPALRDMWRDPRSIAAAAHVGFLAYWEKSGKWPDFCFDPTLPYDCKKEAAKYRV
jgi:tetratricopeptide (TPR) repeat protein